MKKLILLLALGLSLCANAQLTVLESGKVHVGNKIPENLPVIADLIISCQGRSGQLISSGASGTIVFGSSADTKSATFISGNSGTQALSLMAPKSINIGLGALTIISLDGTNKVFRSSYDMKAPSFLTTSDARLKANVESLGGSFGKLQDVNAVSYNLTQTVTADSELTAVKDSSVAAEAIEDDRTRFGFIAQEIQKIYPNLVVEDEDGMLAIDYTGFIPLLVEAYKDLAGKVKEQEEVIDALLGQKGPSYMPSSVNGLADSKASLKQNKPNPFNTTTTIECSVPQSVASAFICVYDLQGKQVHRIDIRERGDIVNVIDAACFAPGMYIYALITDGVEIDSKRMIITD